MLNCCQSRLTCAAAPPTSTTAERHDRIVDSRPFTSAAASAVPALAWPALASRSTKAGVHCSAAASCATLLMCVLLHRTDLKTLQAKAVMAALVLVALLLLLLWAKRLVGGMEAVPPADQSSSTHLLRNCTRHEGI